MAKVTREQLLNFAFSDPRNYPYGFARSGDFSISESKALTEYGCLISALLSGKLACSCEEDESLLTAARQEKEPDTSAERAWAKYAKRISRPKAGSIYGASKNHLETDSGDVIDDTDSSDLIVDEDVVLDEDD